MAPVVIGKSFLPQNKERRNGARKSGQNGAPAPQSRVRGVPELFLRVLATFLFIHPQNSARANLPRVCTGVNAVSRS